MKTKNLFISGLIGLFASCSSQNCKIEGTVENAKDGDTLYLARMSDGNFTPTDTIILHQGKLPSLPVSSFMTKKAMKSTAIFSLWKRETFS